MYTCPDPRHADVIRTDPGTCPRDRRKLVPFRGIWLSPAMAARNAPPNPQPAQTARYRCPLHPLVHSDKPGPCTICARPLQPTSAAATGESVGAAAPTIPAGTKYVCPMRACQTFASEPGTCPKCGMRLKPIEQVGWARDLLQRAGATQPRGRFACPMHPDQQANGPHATCPVCGMRVVLAASLAKPASAPEAIATQMNYLMEHYLALQQRFSSDSTAGVAQHALGLVAAAEEILKYVKDSRDLPPEFAEAVLALRAAAVRTRGTDLDADRVAFVDISRAMRTLVEHVRPDRKRFPKIYVFHCPMTKGDWLQTRPDLANPFYGYKMLKCGELTETK